MKRYLPFVLIALGALLVLTGAGSAYLNQLVQNPQPAPLPVRLAGLSLIAKNEGAIALREVSELHGQDFLLTSGAVGRYGTNHEATLWVSGAPHPLIAARMIASMHEKIGQGNSPFVPLGTRQHNQHTIHELEGMGQKHFYFQSGNLIVWLAVDPELAEQVLQETLAFYR